MKTQGKSLHQSQTINDLHRHFPSIDFDILQQDPLVSQTHDQLNRSMKDNGVSRRLNCSKEPLDFITTEKSINTEERCFNSLKKRFLPLNDEELEEELQKLCEEFQWKDVKNALGPSFDVASTTDLSVISFFFSFNH